MQSHFRPSHYQGVGVEPVDRQFPPLPPGLTSDDYNSLVRQIRAMESDKPSGVTLATRGGRTLGEDGMHDLSRRLHEEPDLLFFLVKVARPYLDRPNYVLITKCHGSGD